MRHRLIAALLVMFGAGACGGTSHAPMPSPVAPPPTPAPPPKDMTPPVFSVPIIELDHVRTFIPFGALLNPSTGQKNPAYELVTTDTRAAVRAVTAGTVVNILQNTAEQADVEVHVRPSPTSIYLVVYDHVRELTVQVGSAVAAGSILGMVGSYGRTELQVNRAEPATEVSICPGQYGTAEFNAAHDFSCPFGAPNDGKPQQAATQREGRESIDSPGGGSQSAKPPPHGDKPRLTLPLPPANRRDAGPSPA